MIEKVKDKLSGNPLLKNYLKVFSVDVLVKGAGILLLPVYLKLMTQEEFGVYGYLIAIITAFSIVFNLGVYIAQSKLYHEYPEEKRGPVLFTLHIILLGFIASLLILVLVFDLDKLVIQFLIKSPINYAAYRFPILLGTVVSVYSLMLVNYFLTSENIRKLQFFNIARIVFVNVSVIVILYWSSGDDHALIRIKYTYVIEFLLLIFFSTFYISKMQVNFDREVAKQTLKISLPIVASALLGLLINLSDRYFIEKFGTLKDLSIYNLAIVISGVVPFVFASFQNIWLPHFLKEKNMQANVLRSKRVVIRLSFLFVALSIATMIVLKFTLLVGIVDSRYESVMPLLPIVLLTNILMSLSPMYSNHLIYLNRLYLVVVVGVPIAILSVVLNLWLVPSFNIYGAAIASLVSSLCYLIAYGFLVDYYYTREFKGAGDLRVR